MVTTNRDAASTADREIRTTRLLDAPRELVWEAWTKPEHVAQWWGPNGFRNTIQEMEVRPGGTWRLIMHGPDGTDYPNLIQFIEVVPPARMVYDHGDGSDAGPQFRTTVTLEPKGDKTELTMVAVFPTAAIRNQVAGYAVEGGKQTIARLAAYLEGMKA